MLKIKTITKELTDARIDEIDLQYLEVIQKYHGAQQVDIAGMTGRPYSSTHNRLLVLERLKVVRLVRGRKSLKCYPGENFSTAVELISGGIKNG
jgi:hypothetical protein